MFQLLWFQAFTFLNIGETLWDSTYFCRHNSEEEADQGFLTRLLLCWVHSWSYSLLCKRSTKSLSQMLLPF
ncbi:unnamed protein product [Brassica rapa subsp. trilocularis]